MFACHDFGTSHENTVHLFYYVAVPLADDVIEEDPNLYKGFKRNSFSKWYLFLNWSPQLLDHKDKNIDMSVTFSFTFVVLDVENSLIKLHDLLTLLPHISGVTQVCETQET